MSQSVTLPSSQKSGEQGILRILRQSVKDLGRLTKADSVAHRKESDEFKHGELNENKPVFEKKCTDVFNLKGVNGQSTSKEAGIKIATKAIEPDKNVENFHGKGFKSGPTFKGFSHRKGGKNKTRYQSKEKRWTNKGQINLAIKNESNSNRNEGEIGTGGHNEDKQEFFKNVIGEVEVEVKEGFLNKTSVSQFEDWDKELHTNIESCNVQSLPADLLSSENWIDKLQIGFSDGLENCYKSVSQTDINNNPVELDNAEVSCKNQDLTCVKNINFVKSESEQIATDCITNDLKYDVSTQEKTEPFVKELKCIDLETDPFEFKNNKEFTADEQCIPFHSTPKKISTEGCSVREVEKELGTETQVSASSVPVTVEQAKTQVKVNFEALIDKVESDICLKKEGDSSENSSSMRKSRGLARSSDGRDHQFRNNPSQHLPLIKRKNSTEFETPPRFKANVVEVKKIEQADGSFMSENIRDFKQNPYRNRLCRQGIERRGYGNTAYHDYQSKNYSRNFERARHAQECRKYVHQKVHLDSDSCMISLLDSNVKTPEKFKSSWNGSRERGIDQTNKSLWKIPVSEDWTSELEATNDEPSLNVDVTKSLSENERRKDEYIERTNEDLQHERQEREYETEKVEEYFDKEQKHTSKEENLSKRGIVDNDNHVVPYLPPSPPVCWPEKEITVKEESARQKEISVEEEKPTKKEIPFEAESSLRKDTAVMEKISLKSEIQSVQDSSEDQCNDTSCLGMNDDLSNEKLAASQTQALYLPPVPLEVIESGDEISWTNENYGKYSTIDESEIIDENSNKGIINLKSEEENRPSDSVQTETSRELNYDNKFIAIGRNKPGDSEEHVSAEQDDDHLGVSIPENTASAIGNENNDDIWKGSEGLGRKDVAEDSSSLSSIYARRDGACVYSGNGNMTSEADVSDLPFDESKAWENDGSGGFCCDKSVEEGVDFESGNLNTEVEQTGYEEYRQTYEQYARYWYKQNAMNADYLQKGQFGPWHPNYPYNYEAYRRWCEHIQMNYYWEMYNRQMQCGSQMPYYWCAEPYSCQDENMEMENHNVGNAVGDKLAGTGEEIDTKIAENRKDSRKAGQSLKNGHQGKTKQIDSSKDLLENPEGINLIPDYWCERMHQWVNQSPEVTNKHDLVDTFSLSECSSEQIKTDLGKVEPVESTGSVLDNSKMKTAQSVQKSSSSCCDKIVKSKDMGIEKTNLKTIENDKDTKVEPKCTCKPSQVQFMLWRSCECEAGKPTRLHKILSPGTVEPSFDLGYQSYESLEHDESSVSKQVDGKAPGFVIQPLCSTPTTQNSDIELSKNKKGMEDSDFQSRSHLDTNRLTLSQLENSSHQKMSSQQPSLKSLIQLQNEKFGYECHDSSGGKNETINKKEHTMFPNVNNNNEASLDMNNQYCKLPTCLSNAAQHLSKASSAIERASVAERIQDNLIATLGSAIDKKITENQQAIERNCTLEGFQGQGNNFREGENIENTLGSTNKEKKENKKSETSVMEMRPLRSDSREKGKVLKNFEVDVNKMPMRGENRMTSFVFEDNQSFGRKTSAKEHAADQSLRLYNYESSSGDCSETSGDENIKFAAFSQSPQISDNEEWTSRTSVMVGKLCDYSGSSEIHKDNNVRRIRNELPSYDIDDCEIPVNEMMESKREKVAVSSGQFDRAEQEDANRPRMLCRPRSPYSVHPPPYRGGAYRPRLRPFSHMEQWPMDPRILSMPPPPPPLQWPPPSTVYQMFGRGFAYGPNTPWESPPGPVYNEPPTDYRMYEEENAKAYARFPQPAPYCHSTDRDGSTVPTNHSPIDEKNKPSATPKARSSIKIVDYGSSDDSSSEIEPFDVNILCKTEEEINSKYGNQLKHTPKKLKKDRDDDSSSIDSADNNQKESRTKLYGKSTAAVKLSRGHTKTLKQKSLKSFSSNERQPPKKMLHDHTKKRTLSGIIAETAGKALKSEGRLDSDQVDAIAQEFPALGSEQEKQLPPFPPLPPVGNSPFWMYTPRSRPALNGKNEENEYNNSKSVSSSAVQPHRKRLPESPTSRYLFSPGQASGFYSPSETDSEATSIRSDWKTNFKLFHNFGVEYIDTHCHLDFLFSREGFKGSFKAYMDKHLETFPDMFKGCVAVFCNPNTFTPSGGLWLDVAKEPNVWIAMGCHPKMATDFTAAAELGLKKCLRHSKCIALGEIGLDYSGTFYQHAEVQKQVFRRQLKMALDLEKVLVIHCRQAESDCLEIMKEMVPRNWKIHCHCFTNEYKNAKLWIDAFPNLFIGVTPLVTYRTAKPTHDLARNIPINKLLLETDAPYFVPRCIPKEDLPLSNPGLAVTVAKEIAQYQELTVAAVLRQCRLNTKFMYGI
ncbi:uncharacterized protein LOC123528711 isoform X2 [Mercenaria mercenaria]|uniref:uncharacterized protein LOC123528711 isoform X2 n=1 Tax=Mercenaria mercenaria TaxID=6596 RepID=UPI00234F548D|nr:uncharacterized protein LOC123528711 isoform X2 [Mercenaria mercenaria]